MVLRSPLKFISGIATLLWQFSHFISGILLRVLLSKVFNLLVPGLLLPNKQIGEANFKMKSEVILEDSCKKIIRTKQSCFVQIEIDVS